MKKGLASLLVAVVFFTMLSTTAFAANTNTVNYYDENGNQIAVNGLYYNSDGYPMYNASSYYTDADGNSVYVGGCRAYYYDADGNLVAGNYYYNTNGEAVTPPTSYPSGRGCGTYYYNAKGNVVNGTYYYDDFGNPVDPPATTRRTYRGNGCGCGWC